MTIDVAGKLLLGDTNQANLQGRWIHTDKDQNNYQTYQFNEINTN